ncbi:TPA: hypothetical protein ACS7XC_002551 [Providencia alcalifaciens]
MPMIGSPVLDNRRLSNTGLTPASITKNDSVASQITSVHSSGGESISPVHQEINNQISIAGNRNELHQHNHIQQSEDIHLILTQFYPNITKSMVLSVLCAGASGNLAQQEINYRPENNLILLTLLNADELNNEKALLDAAANLIKKLYGMGEKNAQAKHLLTHEEKTFDKLIESAVSALGKDKLQILGQRYQQRYVDPAIKETLGNYFSEDEIALHPVSDFLVSSLSHGCDMRANAAIQEYQQHTRKSFVDKACQIHNLFLALEEKIETIRPLKVHMDLASSPALSPEKTPVTDDEVDGIKPRFAPSSPELLTPNTPLLPSNTSHNENMYNTYITNNYYTSPAENTHINSVQSNNDNKEETPLLPTSLKSVMNVKLMSSTGVEKSGHTAKQPEIPTVDYPQRTVDEPKIEQPRIDEKATLSRQPVETEKLPMGSFANRYTKVLDIDPVTGNTRSSWKLVDENELTSQPVLMAEKPHTEVSPNKYSRVLAVDSVTGNTRSSWHSENTETSSVTLSERGALTRDQSAQERYQQTTETDSSAQNTVFANRFEAVEVTDELTGQRKKTWQLADAKTSKPVTLTEMGALTRDQVAKEKYDDNGKHFS